MEDCETKIGLKVYLHVLHAWYGVQLHWYLVYYKQQQISTVSSVMLARGQRKFLSTMLATSANAQDNL